MSTRKFTRLIALALALVLCLGLAACGNGAASKPASSQPANSQPAGSQAAPAPDGFQPAADTQPGAASFNVGFNNFILGLQVQDLMQRYSEFVMTTMGSTITAVNDEGSVEKTMQNAQNLISSGVDAMIVFVVSDNLALSIGRMCQEANIPFVLNCSAITDEGVKAEIMGMDMFVGLVSDNHALYGKMIAEYALSQGCETAIISGAEYGSYTQDTKINAFRETFEAGGGEVLAEARCNSASSDNMNTVTDDLIVSNLTADCFYCANCLVANAAAENLKKYGDQTEMLLLSTELDSEMAEYLRSGLLNSTTYASYTDNIFSTILLYNYLIGNPIRDAEGNAPYLEEVGTSVVTPEMSALFEKLWFDQNPISEDYVRSMCDGTLTYDKFVEEVRGFSANTVFKAKLEAGVITEADLEAAGVVLD